MALEASIRPALRRLAAAFAEYAPRQGWGRDDYRLFVRLNLDWGQIHLLLVARSFAGINSEDPWLSVMAFLERTLKDDPRLVESLHLVLRTFEEVEQGGLYAIGSSYVPIEDLLGSARPSA